MKVIINSCYGGFSLSHEATMRYAEISGLELFPYIDETTKEIWGIETIEELLAKDGMMKIIHYAKVPQEEYLAGTQEQQDEWYFSDRDLDRDDPALIQVVEEMGEKADGMVAALKIVEIPDDVNWHIDEYDGNEHVAQDHQTWG